VPRPTQVHGESLEGLEGLGQSGSDGEAAQGLHAPDRSDQSPSTVGRRPESSWATWTWDRVGLLASGSVTDADWYRRAIFYEVLVRGFNDSNADGTGDLRGVTEKLDYLEWLGVDCLWLLPFYQSPLRDGGYDISDFFTVLPAYGTVGD